MGCLECKQKIVYAARGKAKPDAHDGSLLIPIPGSENEEESVLRFATRISKTDVILSRRRRISRAPAALYPHARSLAALGMTSGRGAQCVSLQRLQCQLYTFF